MADRRTNETVRFLMGVGLDSDGHARITKGEEFLLLGGTEDTHGEMREHVERFEHALKKMGTDLQRASNDEMIEAAEKSGLL